MGSASDDETVNSAQRNVALSVRLVAEGLGMTDAKLADLFGTTAHELCRWRSADVPARRQQELRDVAAIVESLVRKLKPGRLPDVARRQAPAYGGLSLLDMLAAGRRAEVRDAVSASLDFASSA